MTTAAAADARRSAAGPTAAATPAGPAAERRYVSVLFADLVGFTTLSEQHDPEQVRELLSEYFNVAREVIAGYAGTIEKFIGDAVMAVWGAPVAHEDDAERAVRAALDLVSRVRELRLSGAPIELRAAVHSGEAAVTVGLSGEGMVAGDLVNTASRLQSIAPPGVVLVGGATQQATSAAIAYEPAGEQLLKGKQAPVAAWRALRVVARVGGAGREEGLEPPFVGRDEELRLLKDQLHAAEREHKLRMVAITGQAGIGKSRLIWELEKYLDGLAGPALYYWHQGRSPSYGEGVTFWALGEMVRRRANIAEGEDESSTREKLRQTLAEFVPDAQERRWLEPALGVLLGIDEADWGAREQLFSAWRTFFERIADKGPTVLAFEDLQWADNGLLDFVEHLLEWTRDQPILIVTLARPELLERRPNFGMGRRALVALHLEPLADEAMSEMLRGLVPALAQEDLARIIERAAGVPLYAVEMVRALADGGHLVRQGDIYELHGDLPALDVPPTLRALISSRLDALDADDRALLQDAAVLGQVFSITALAVLTGKSAEEVEPRLRALAHKELLALESDPRSPERGQHHFKQGLIREISYAMLSKRERRSRHLAAARYFDTLGDDELAGMLASHYLEAFQAAPEGEEGAAVAAQARVALRAAADRAVRLHSHDQARTYFEQAMAVTFEEEDLNDLRVRAGRAAWITGNVEAALANLAAAKAWHEQRGDLDHAGDITAQMGSWLLESSRIDEAMSMLGTALAGLPSEESRAGIALNGQLARGHLFRGEGEPAATAVSHALETAERLQIRAPTLQLIITKSWALGMLGRFREAVALLTGAMHMADQEDELFSRMRARYNLSSYVIIEDPHRSLEIAQAGIAIDLQYGISAASMAGNAAHAAQIIGDLDEVLRLEAGTIERSGSLGAFVHGHAAIALALRGDRAGVQERMATVESQVAGSSSAQDAATLHYIQACIALAEGRLADARRLAVQSAEEYPRAGDMAIVLAAHVALLMGDAVAVNQDREWFLHNATAASWVDKSRRAIDAGALALDGSFDESARLYRRVIDEWRTADLRFDLALTLLERARLLGDRDKDAAEGRAEAQAIFAAMGADGLIERLEAGAPAGRPVKRSPAPRPLDAEAARR